MKTKEEGKSAKDEDEESAFGAGGGWATVEKKGFEATNGWQIPGNTFRGGKEF